MCGLTGRWLKMKIESMKIESTALPPKVMSESEVLCRRNQGGERRSQPMETNDSDVVVQDVDSLPLNGPPVLPSLRECVPRSLFVVSSLDFVREALLRIFQKFLQTLTFFAGHSLMMPCRPRLQQCLERFEPFQVG